MKRRGEPLRLLKTSILQFAARLMGVSSNRGPKRIKCCSHLRSQHRETRSSEAHCAAVHSLRQARRTDQRLWRHARDDLMRTDLHCGRSLFSLWPLEPPNWCHLVPAAGEDVVVNSASMVRSIHVQPLVSGFDSQFRGFQSPPTPSQLPGKGQLFSLSLGISSIFWTRSIGVCIRLLVRSAQHLESELKLALAGERLSN